jgi:hypothetical protein
MLGKLGNDISALACPAFDTSRSIVTLLDSPRINDS